MGGDPALREVSDMSRRMHRPALLLVVVFILIVTCGHPASSQLLTFSESWSASDWRFEISLEKSKYLPGEAVWVDFVLRNVSEDTLFIEDSKLDPNNFNLSFDVTARNDTLPFIGYHPNCRPIWPRWLFPGGTLTGTVNICTYYGEPVEGNRWEGWLFHPGIYSLQGIALREVPSNRLEFEVMEPSGEDVKIFEVLHRAQILAAQYSREATAELLFPLLPRATNSVYRDQIYRVLRWAVALDYPKAAEVGREALKINPNTRYARTHLFAVFWASTPEEGRRYVESLERKAPGSRVAVLGRELLDGFKEWNKSAGAQ
jgi:hypothetical protein